ncbi:MAG: FapA family protein [Clostridiales bacterium]|nr:FapA family protein [Clostridiales bacterium]
MDNHQHETNHAENEPIHAIPKITIASDGMSAEMTIFPPYYGGAHVTDEEIRKALAEAGVQYGIDEGVIDLAVKKPMYDQSYVVARGLDAVDGQPARLEFKVELGRDSKPKENPDGTVDYKDLGIIENVMQEDVLCVKIPATQGEVGCNVLCVKLQPRPGRDLALPMGQNTKLSEDGLQLLAVCDGQVDMVGSKLQVLNTFTVKTDVGNATGNINFVGNLVIQGNILTGFSVQASGNITVNGWVEDATVIAGGNIVLKDGIQGKGSNSPHIIEAGGFIKSKYIQDSNVKAVGDIESTAVLRSYVLCSGNVNVIGSKGRVTGGRVVARNSINTAYAGGRNIAVPTILEVGNNPATTERYQYLTKQIETMQTQMNSLRPAITMLGELEKSGTLSGDRLDALNQARSAYQAIEENLASLQQEVIEVKEEMDTLGYGYVNIKRTAYPGVRIIIGAEQTQLDTEHTASSFARGETGIYFGPYIG